VDGAPLATAFGLATSGGGTGRRRKRGADQPGRDRSISVNIAPFDVRESNFAGASINAITRSGDNSFHGSIYGVGRNEDLVGEGSRIGCPWRPSTITPTARAWPDQFSKTFSSSCQLRAETRSHPVIGDTTKFNLASVQNIINITQNQYGIRSGRYRAVGHDH